MCCGSRDSTESRLNLEDIILVPSESLVTMTVVTLALTSSHLYALPSSPAKYLSGYPVTYIAGTESPTISFIKVVLYIPLPTPIPNFGTGVSVWL